MANFNQVTLAGRLTRDPQQRSFGDNKKTEFGLAVNRFYRQNEEKKEETSFFDCELWGPQGDTLVKWSGKGKEVLVTGRLKQDSWEDKNGDKRSKVFVHVENFQFLGSPNNDENNSSNANERQNSKPNNNGSKKTYNNQSKNEQREEDIPF